MVRSAWPLALWLAACQSPEPATHAPVAETPVDVVTVDPLDGARSRSGTIATSEDQARTIIVDPDNQSVLLFRHLDGHSASTVVGGEPTRLVRVGQDVFVTLRASGELVRLHDDHEQLTEVARVSVGAEPFDVIAAGDTLYVSLSQEDAVVALDLATLAPTGRWQVKGEPKWMAVTAAPTGGDRLFVASALGGQVTRLDADNGESISFGLPRKMRFNQTDCIDHPLASRITGELALDEGTGRLYVPAWYADTVIDRAGLRFAEGVSLPEDDTGGPADGTTGGPTTPCEDPPDTNEGPPPDGAYGMPTGVSNPAAVSRFNASLVEFDTHDNTARVLALGSVVRGAAGPAVSRGLPTALELSHEGDQLWVHVALESTSSIVSLKPDVEVDEHNTGTFVTTERISLPTGAGPNAVRRVAQDAGAVQVWSWIDRRLVSFTENAAQDNGEPVAADLLTAPASQLDATVLAGRELFFRSDLPVMAAAGSGVSCSSCHADGRTDGFTWQFADFPRQTPSLAGDITQTTPMTWTGGVMSVAEEAHLTSQQRMGGAGVSYGQAAQLEAYIAWSRPVVRPTASGDEHELAAQGREIFRRPEVGCAACHQDARGTSALIVPIFGLETVSVPVLQGIGATAPYFHDGSAPDLRTVLERAKDGSMGNTSSLTEQELLALETFLRLF